jgi:gamma-glutamylcyclotransferase (GGCT)/AIG2-like uncharacterized protein YtfP
MSARILFVYGTLRRELSHEMSRVLARDAEFLGAGRVKGRLFILGSYPGMVLSESGGQAVVGELYQVRPHAWKKVIGELDSYEGCAADDAEPHAYRRVIVDAGTASGERVRAWAYVLDRTTAHLEEIASGDYVAWRASPESSRR